MVVNSPVDSQVIIDVAFGLTGILGGWVLSVLWSSVRDLRNADTTLADKLQSVEILVAGQYVRRDDMEKMSFELFRKLDRIETKLDGKADKS